MKKKRLRKGARLGQHFLLGAWAARAIARAARISKGDTVLEIGPGKGALTRVLLETGARVVAVEKDPKLAGYLRDAFAQEVASGQFSLWEGDVRDVSPSELGLKNSSYILAANIPYYITGHIVRTFLTAPERPRIIALLVQKEVAERIVAKNKKESILSLSVKAFGAPRIAARVSRKNFSPPPKVDSAIIVIEDIKEGFSSKEEEGRFFTLVRIGFSSKRKKLVRNLKKCGYTKEVFRVCGVAPDARAEDLYLEHWRRLLHHWPGGSR